ncbi:glutathione S-transferase [Tilletiaria anomala UBC 951]|uniref:Glutathione S-transferase n=1 Tax=Tilletiaria anomala (strain ATCC 24038 / CBS 436.72 / UBC 951) TaxID=1037660 RepID=A0A066VD64_TILAU|nr:glutathione S-transferase [Tilletiaria anomala UBC 951]KDN39692.1 glutathione S-transferase [Tilletiaria anomala UBC 951]
MIGRLYGPSEDASKTWRTLVVARLLQLEIEFVKTSKTGESKSDEYKAKFPMAKVPAFEGADGLLLTESRAIARYVASLGNLPDGSGSLLGDTPHKAALVDQWLQFSDDELFNNTTAITASKWGAPFDVRREAFHWWGLRRALTCLDGHMQKPHTEHGANDASNFLVGNHITLADVSVFGNVHMAFRDVAGKETRDAFPSLMRWYDQIRNHPLVAQMVRDESWQQYDYHFNVGGAKPS